MIIFTRLFENEKREFFWPETLVQQDIDQRRRMVFFLFKKLGQQREKKQATKGAPEERLDDNVDGGKFGNRVLDVPSFDPPSFILARLQFLSRFNEGVTVRFEFEEKTRDAERRRRGRPKR